jgi:hypothetical protein
MLLDRSKIPSAITTHEQLMAWAASCIAFNMNGTAQTLTFMRSATDPNATRLIDAGIFSDAAGVARFAIVAFPPVSPSWIGATDAPWKQVMFLSQSAQAAMFDS